MCFSLRLTSPNPIEMEDSPETAQQKETLLSRKIRVTQLIALSFTALTPTTLGIGLGGRNLDPDVVTGLICASVAAITIATSAAKCYSEYSKERRANQELLHSDEWGLRQAVQETVDAHAMNILAASHSGEVDSHGPSNIWV